MTDRPRTWEIGVFSRAPQVGPAIVGPHPGDNEWVRVVEAAPVIAALDAIAAELALEAGTGASEKIMQNVNRALGELRRAVSDA